MVWSTNGELRFNLWSPVSGWATAAPVTSSTEISILTVPYLVSGGNGAALAVWIENGLGAAEYILFGSWFDGSAWGPATPLSTQTGIIIFRDSVRVAADKQGNAVVAWQHIAGDPNDPASLRSVRYRNGAWEAPMVLSENGTGINLAVNAAGDTVVVYAENREVTARGFTATNPVWSDPVKITEFPLRGNAAGVALEPDGSVIAVWVNRSDGTLWSSRGRIP